LIYFLFKGASWMRVAIASGTGSYQEKMNRLSKLGVLFFVFMMLFPELRAEVRNGERDQNIFLGSDALVFQMYGYAGEVAFGLEWLTSGEEVGFMLLLGKANQYSSGNEIRQVTLKLEWHPSAEDYHSGSSGNRLSWEPLYAGMSLLAIDCGGSNCDENRVFMDLPDHYPSGYYSATAINPAIHFGTSVRYKGLVFYAEVVTTFIGLDAYFHNSDFFREHYDYAGFEGISSLGIGLKIGN
jgi:hypothetical protein